MVGNWHDLTQFLKAFQSCRTIPAKMRKRVMSDALKKLDIQEKHIQKK